MDVHMLETDVFKINFSNFYILETMLYILLKLVQFALTTTTPV